MRALDSFKLLVVFIFTLPPTSNRGNPLERRGTRSLRVRLLDPNKQIWGELESEAAEGMSSDPWMVEHAVRVYISLPKF